MAHLGTSQPLAKSQGLRLGLRPATFRLLETMIHCLHGSAGCHTNWDLFEKSLGEEINSIDLWSLFESDKQVTLREAGRLVAKQATDGDLLMGYSMGGRIALHSLLFSPEKWRGAIIIAANPGIADGHKERKARDEEWAQLAETNWEAFLKHWNEQPLLTSPHGVSMTFQNPSSEKSAKVARSFRDWSLGRQFDLRPDLSKITCPVLWLTGTKDEKFSAIARDSVSRIPLGRMISVPNASHRLPWQQPDSFARIVKDFVELSSPF